jgi:1-acyl-sn-glycerol-3-phosphate acyltransferase
VFGWYLMRAGSIRIDRGGAGRALRSLVEGGRAAAARGCSVLIFPEGTRRAPDAPPDYKPGVAALYAALKLPVVPVALNSGLFWGRRSFRKRPGRIVVEFLEPIPPGLDRRTFMAELERRIEGATARLVAEGRAGAAP